MRLIAISMFFLVALSHAVEDPFTPEKVMARMLARNSVPLGDLPKEFTAPKDKVSLLSNFTPEEDGKVTVYVVNRTKNTLKLDCQDGVPYLKLEYQKDSQWVRAQAHAYSWCGNSYDSIGNVHVLPNHFVRLKGYRPKEGQKATIRYRIYQKGVEVVSPAAAGLIDPVEVKKAANDVMNIAFGDFAFIKALALGEKTLKNEVDHITDTRDVAIRYLSEFPEEQVKPILELIEKREPKKYEEAINTVHEIYQSRKEEKSKEK